MQISRRFLWFFLTAILISPLALRAQDSKTAKPAAVPAAVVVASAPMAESQGDEKIREALHKKESELDAEKAAAPVTPPPPPPPAPKQKPKPVQTSEPVYMPLPASNPPPVKLVTEPAKPKPSQSDKTVTKTAEPKKPEPKKVEAKTASSSSQPASRDAAIDAAVAESNANQARTDREAKANQPMARRGNTQKSRSTASSTASSGAPMAPFLQAPPSSLSGKQQARLQALDQQYLSDQLTSEQYHAQRAKIISEP